MSSVIFCECGSIVNKTYLKKHVMTSRHRRWEDQKFVDRLDREMDELIVSHNNIKMSEVDVIDLDLENKEPKIMENTVPRGDTPRHPSAPAIEENKKIKVFIHCAETRLLLQCASIGFGIACFGMLLWIVARK
jgi:hypothetical protein